MYDAMVEKTLERLANKNKNGSDWRLDSVISLD